MTASYPALIVAVVVAISLAGLVAWVAYALLPEKVVLRNQSIVKQHRRKLEQMAVSELSEIKYRYHAVVGFVAVWEFIDRDSNSMSVDAEARGLGDVLSSLEKLLPGFSLTEF